MTKSRKKDRKNEEVRDRQTETKRKRDTGRETVRKRERERNRETNKVRERERDREGEDMVGGGRNREKTRTQAISKECPWPSTQSLRLKKPVDKFPTTKFQQCPLSQVKQFKSACQ